MAAQLVLQFGKPATALRPDGGGGIVLEMQVPHVAGPAIEVIASLEGAERSGPAPGALVLTTGSTLAGAIVRPVKGVLDALSLDVYRDLLALTEGWHVCRIWNYVPDINGETTGLENYRRFNLGRWQAYRDAFGDDFPTHLPAASAVGIDDPSLVTVFLASREPVRMVENPQQVPAWRYPELYGPKPPGFARGAILENGGPRDSWVSGTASIKGHESLGVGSVETQLAITLDNIRLVHGALGVPSLESADGCRHSAKIYLRNGTDWQRLAPRLAAAGLSQATVLEADICRKELDLEIEVTTRQAAA